MKEWVLEIEEDDGVDDAGTLRANGDETEEGEPVYPIVNINIDRQPVIMGIPLPLIYLAETMDGTLVIVDGRQRLTTFLITWITNLR